MKKGVALNVKETLSNKTRMLWNKIELVWYSGIWYHTVKDKIYILFILKYIYLLVEVLELINIFAASFICIDIILYYSLIKQTLIFLEIIYIAFWYVICVGIKESKETQV